MGINIGIIICLLIALLLAIGGGIGIGLSVKYLYLTIIPYTNSSCQIIECNTTTFSCWTGRSWRQCYNSWLIIQLDSTNTTSTTNTTNTTSTTNTTNTTSTTNTTNTTSTTNVTRYLTDGGDYMANLCQQKWQDEHNNQSVTMIPCYYQEPNINGTLDVMVPDQVDGPIIDIAIFCIITMVGILCLGVPLWCMFKAKSSHHRLVMR
jgi:hypothetical protein